jgi:hypothetical protein
MEEGPRLRRRTVERDGFQFLSLVISLAQTCLMSCARLTIMIHTQHTILRE